MRKLVLVAFAVLSSIFFAGCATYRLVDVSVQTDINKDVSSETTKVLDFQQRMAEYKNIVVSLPKDYYDSGTTLASKGISESTVLLRESHALWITEIEREFLKKGYKVLSRQKYQELIREKKVKTSKEVGALLGADVIVQINTWNGWRQAPPLQ
ncbi:hypothetical protein KAW08_03445 [bacterium]|nr:hypothetical protein [bacterium]